jgi:hypothetical protein
MTKPALDHSHLRLTRSQSHAEQAQPEHRGAHANAAHDVVWHGLQLDDRGGMAMRSADTTQYTPSPHALSRPPLPPIANPTSDDMACLTSHCSCVIPRSRGARCSTCRPTKTTTSRVMDAAADAEADGRLPARPTTRTIALRSARIHTQTRPISRERPVTRGITAEGSCTTEQCSGHLQSIGCAARDDLRRREGRPTG